MEYLSREEYDKSFGYNTKENCVFCCDNIINNKILYETDYFVIIFNKYPYFGDEKQLLVAPKRHIEFTIELNEEELLDYIKVEKYIREFYKNDEYFSLVRQSRSNKSVEHLHYHYIRGIPRARIIEGENYFKI